MNNTDSHDDEACSEPRHANRVTRQRFDAWLTDSPVHLGPDGDYPDQHAAAVDFCFPPPDGYDESPWLDRIFALYGFVLAAPCTCIDPDDEPCQRCKLLNAEGYGR